MLVTLQTPSRTAYAGQFANVIMCISKLRFLLTMRLVMDEVPVSNLPEGALSRHRD